MARLALYFLRSPRVVLDGQDIHLGRRKAVALLAYLAVTKRTHTREALATLFWPEYDASSALGYLRRILSELTKSLGARWLTVDRETAALNPEEVWLDVDTFHQHLAACETPDHPAEEVRAECVQHLEEAVALYQDGFLAGFNLRDSVAFDEWQFFQTEALRDAMMVALAQLVRWYEGLGTSAFEQAIAYARRWLALDPLHETAHRHLMVLYAQAGQRSAALRQYQECVKVLKEELGASPSAETTELYEAIRAQQIKPRAEADAIPISIVPGAPEQPAEALRPVAQPEIQVPATDVPAPLESERRMATVLVARIKGAAALAEQWDVETWMELMDRIFQSLSHEVQRYGGKIDQYRQGSLVALFGVPTAHEDDPERAVLAALAMQQALRQISDLPETLALQVGIDTGEVVALANEGLLAGDRGFSHEGTVRGLPLTLAARLAEATAPGTVLVAEATYRRGAALFDWQALGRLQVQGVREPLALFRALSHKDLPTKGRGIEGLESPLVGRDAEFNALQQAVENVRAGLGGIVTVVGEAGIGKSRLVAELRKAANQESRIENQESNFQQPASTSQNPKSKIQNPQWIEGRCLSYATNVAYQVWLDMLRAWLDTVQDATPDAVRATLRARVARVCPDIVDEVYPFMVRLLSLPADAETTARLRGVEAEGLQFLTFRAVETLIESATQQQPLILVCEDLHWGDPTSLALLEALLPLTDRVPLLLLCVMRPVTEHGCWHIKERASRDYRHRHTDLWLEPLSADQSSTLVGNLLHIEDLSPKLRDRILEHAEGNPFFLEEILRSLIEDEALVYNDTTGHWATTREIDTLAIPDTLHGVLSARIDRLPIPAKRVLQRAAVIGRAFSLRVLEAIAPPPLTPAPEGEGNQTLESQLVVLQRAQLIRERARLPEREYIFKHVLTQEAAYSGLLKRERRAVHRQVAETLERLYPERVEDQLGLLAHHWEQAGDAERAIPYLRQAGEQAAARYANAEAVAYFSRALDLLPVDCLEKRLALLLAREDIHHLQGARDAQQQDLLDLQDVVAALDDESAQVIVILHHARYALRTGTGTDSLWSLMRETLPVIERLPDVEDRARSYLLSGRLLGYPTTEGREQLEKAVQLARAAKLKDIEAESLRELGLTLFVQKAPEQASLCLQRGLQLSREIGNRKLEGMIYGIQTIILTEAGNDDAEAQRYAELAIRLNREVGFRSDEGHAIQRLAEVHYHQGAYAAVLHYARQALTCAYETQSLDLEFYMLRNVSRVFGDLGQYAEAIAYYESVLHDVRETHTPMWLVALCFVGLYAHYSGDDARAKVCGEEVLRISQAMGEEAAEAWGIIGHSLTGLGQLDEAVAAYRRALEGTQGGLERDRLLIRAGLIRIALLKGDTKGLQEALLQVEEILRYWDAHPALRDVAFERFETCWTCYRLLQALQDPRAPEVLDRTYALVHTQATKLQDPEHRRMFMENVAVHRDIVAEWERLHPSA
jgi:predicted ATPase/DNA-binding SARP family transcriptional activator/class 3 adenylate cyclase